LLGRRISFFGGLILGHCCEMDGTLLNKETNI